MIAHSTLAPHLLVEISRKVSREQVVRTNSVASLREWFSVEESHSSTIWTDDLLYMRP